MDSKHTVAVLGLGQMGRTLAKLLVQAGVPVLVWNRSPGKAAGLPEAPSAAAAIAAADIVVMCVLDYRAAEEILAGEGVRRALAGKLLIQLSTGSPRDAHSMAALLEDSHAAFLGGAIQVAPDQMGRPDTTILVSGKRAAFERAGAVLATFGGNVVYLGESAPAAATMDLATLSYIYGASAGFFQGAALAQAEGLDVAAYADIVHKMTPSFGDFLQHEGKVVASGDFAISQSPLSISVQATERIHTEMVAAGVNAELPALMARLLRQADAAGYGKEEFAAVVKLLAAA